MRDHIVTNLSKNTILFNNTITGINTDFIKTDRLIELKNGN